jgi:hypothetical protein
MCIADMIRGRRGVRRRLRGALRCVRCVDAECAGGDGDVVVDVNALSLVV